MANKRCIVYDLSAAQPMGSSPVSGGGTYAKRVYYKLLESLADAHNANAISIYGVASSSTLLDPELVKISDQNSVKIIYSKDLVSDVLDILSQYKASVFFSALPLRFKKLRFPASVKFIYTIHGLRPLELVKDKYEYKFFHSIRSIAKYALVRILPRWYIRRRQKDFKQLINSAPNHHVITVSKHTRYALLAEYPNLLQPERISTFYSPPGTFQSEIDESILKQVGVTKKDFFLLICGNRWAKNPWRAIKAFRALAEKGLLKKQVLISGRGKARYLKKVAMWDGFIVTNYLPASQLNALYKYAYAFVFPTLNEGFGYPPLECMAHATPVVTSPINSLPELLGDAVLWANPYDIREMEGRLLRLQNDANLYASLAENSVAKHASVWNKQQQDLHELVQCILQ